MSSKVKELILLSLMQSLFLTHNRFMQNTLILISFPQLSLFFVLEGYHRSRTKNKDNWGKLIFPPKMKVHWMKFFLFARLTSDFLFAYSFSGTICFSNALLLEKNSCISNSFLQSSQKTFFHLLISWLSEMLKLPCKINLPQIPKQPRQLTVLTMPDDALRLCAARLH